MINTAALGHVEGTGVVMIPPTATTEGEMTFYCMVCGEEPRTAVISVLGEGNRTTICGVSG